MLHSNHLTMDSPASQPRAVVSNDGDVLIIPGSASPILFIPRSHVRDLLEARPQSAAILIDDVGAAAVATFLAAGATFDAATNHTASDEIESVTIRFTLPNGLVCIWTSDEAVADNRSRLKSLGIDLAVTNTAINWERKHAGLIGEMISAVPQALPQLVSLRHFDPATLAKLVRDAETSGTEEASNE